KAGASAIALATGISVAPAYADSYVAGDFHNHTTCNDGSYSVNTMLTTSLSNFGLDWIGDAGHGGTATRDCRFDDPQGDGSATGTGAFFDNTVGLPAFKGDNAGTSGGHRNMWVWQIIQDYNWPEMLKVYKAQGNTMSYMGMEQVVPGHEHSSTSVIF